MGNVERAYVANIDHDEEGQAEGHETIIQEMRLSTAKHAKLSRHEKSKKGMNKKYNVRESDVSSCECGMTWSGKTNGMEQNTRKCRLPFRFRFMHFGG